MLIWKIVILVNTVPKVIDFPRYNTKCSGEHEILRRIFRLVFRFPLHFVLYLGNFDYFLDSYYCKKCLGPERFPSPREFENILSSIWRYSNKNSLNIRLSLQTQTGMFVKHPSFRGLKTVFRIRISFHADPDPGSLKCPYGFGAGSRLLIFYSYPDLDPEGVKIKEDNLYKHIFN